MRQSTRIPTQIRTFVLQTSHKARRYHGSKVDVQKVGRLGSHWDRNGKRWRLFLRVDSVTRYWLFKGPSTRSLIFKEPSRVLSVSKSLHKSWNPTDKRSHFPSVRSTVGKVRPIKSRLSISYISFDILYSTNPYDIWMVIVLYYGVFRDINSFDTDIVRFFSFS